MPATNTIADLSPEAPQHMSSSYDAPGGDRNAAVRPLRVLHVVAGNLYGGVETYLATVARLGRLNPNLIHAFAICYSGRLQEELVAAGAEVHELGAVRLSRPWTVGRARKRLATVLRDRHWDAVAVHGCWPHAVFARAVKRAGTKLVHVVHNDLAKPGLIDRMAALRGPDLVVANSEFTAAGARRLFRGAPVEICRLPVERPIEGATTRSAVRSELNTPDDRIVVAIASRMDPAKGHRELLAALTNLANEPDWECWIIGGAQRAGETEYVAELERSIADGAICDRVRFLGQRNDVRRLLAAADIYCQPNLLPESFGLVFVEAMYAGLPVVTSNFGGACEIVKDQTGVLLPPGNIKGLADSLRCLICDIHLRRQLGDAGQLRAAELCDPAAHFRNFHRVISRALQHLY